MKSQKTTCTKTTAASEKMPSGQFSLWQNQDRGLQFCWIPWNSTAQLTPRLSANKRQNQRLGDEKTKPGSELSWKRKRVLEGKSGKLKMTGQQQYKVHPIRAEARCCLYDYSKAQLTYFILPRRPFLPLERQAEQQDPGRHHRWVFMPPRRNSTSSVILN